MTRCAVDAPTLLRLAAGELVVHPDHQLVAPQLVRSRALALLLDAVRREELTEAEALRRLEALSGVRVRLLGDRVSRRTAWGLARERGWDSTGDLEHVAVALLQADALVTADPVLAVGARGVVEVLDPAVLAVAGRAEGPGGARRGDGPPPGPPGG